MFFALLALRSIRIPIKLEPTILTTVPTEPIIPPVSIQNDDEYDYDENKFKIKKVIKKIKDVVDKTKKVVDVIDEVTNDEEDDDEYEVEYVLEEAPELGENKFRLKKFFKKLGKVVKVVTKVIKIGSKIISVIANDEENFAKVVRRCHEICTKSIPPVCTKRCLSI
ncbi:hypothetical protein GPJ56_005646 [Histomonas meleagridis]|uniref:uncharacterized protein n=1 Tax=Histomonas meleagridis TaxID=135588 RepID=UPI003559AF09|nr:hypothetical protein GPJ56_005646 [Histomonas meleagridis]KAH0803419.1 hypothetical protein GO595_003763 [Histomonas meleagridis]